MKKFRIPGYGLVLLAAGIIIGLLIASGFNFTKSSSATPPKPVSPTAAPLQAGEQLTGAQILDALTNAFANVAEKVNPSVVTIFTQTKIKRQPFPRTTPFEEFFGDEFFKRFFQIPEPQGDLIQRGLGSGVIVRDDGIILTNNHVVQGADDIRVRLIDGKEYKAEIKGKDSKTDLAVLQIDAKNLPAIKFGDSDKIRVGEFVLAIGSPLNPQFAHTVTAGIISAKGRSGIGLTQYEDYIQTDAAINPGNSGGALVNMRGELVGINSAIATQTGGYQGIGFAIPSNLASKIMSDILEKGKVVRGWLGVYIQNVTDELAKSLGLSEPEGVIITQVQENSPAEKAGLKEEDVILKIDNRPVKNVNELSTWVAATAPGTVVTLTILRDGKQEEVKVKLGELPEEETEAKPAVRKSVAKLGFQVANLTPEIREQYNLDKRDRGVVIVQVQPGSYAERLGLQAGDLIMKINRKPVTNVKEFNKEFQKLNPGDPVAFFIKRGQNQLFVSFTVPEE